MMAECKEEPRNPLDLPEIIQKICDYLSFRTVQTSRLVNRTWCNAATRAAKNKCFLTVGFSNMKNTLLQHSQHFSLFEVIHSTGKITNFLKDLQTQRKRELEVPLHKLIVEISTTTLEILPQFLEAIGPVVEELTLHYDVRLRFPNKFRKSVLTQKLALPLLRKLRLVFVDPVHNMKPEIDGFDSDGFVELLSNIIRSSPLIESLCVYNVLPSGPNSDITGRRYIEILSMCGRTQALSAIICALEIRFLPGPPPLD